MTYLTQTSELRELRAKSGWLVALGALYIIAGIIALGSVVWSTAVSVLIVGIMMLIAGVGEVISAFQIRSWGNFVLVLIVGALFIVAGFATIQNPLLAAKVLTLVLGASLVASGVMRLVLALSMMEGSPWVWVLLSGIVTLLLGFVILARWPVSSLYTLGIFLGVDLLIVGLGWVGAGLGLKQASVAD